MSSAHNIHCMMSHTHFRIKFCIITTLAMLALPRFAFVYLHVGSWVLWDASLSICARRKHMRCYRARLSQPRVSQSVARLAGAFQISFQVSNRRIATHALVASQQWFRASGSTSWNQKTVDGATGASSVKHFASNVGRKFSLKADFNLLGNLF